jgi:hypothetical protein
LITRKEGRKGRRKGQYIDSYPQTHTHTHIYMKEERGETIRSVRFRRWEKEFNKREEEEKEEE